MSQTDLFPLLYARRVKHYHDTDFSLIEHGVDLINCYYKIDLLKELIKILHCSFDLIYIFFLLIVRILKY